ncbi:hypothetical protein PENNAL_c0015G01106 [Penicillium nalgiovense]|uniref:Uncharacterized protein n=1 Tax=Penicillium nalgiovense TaxID=60175 RepID=A0A1V6YNC2_PENNA|nr:hypothetical protein PENNAL_c0015G01106 [Penicillium nalgiovense]
MSTATSSVPTTHEAAGPLQDPTKPTSWVTQAQDARKTPLLFSKERKRRARRAAEAAAKAPPPSTEVKNLWAIAHKAYEKVAAASKRQCADPGSGEATTGRRPSMDRVTAAP